MKMRSVTPMRIAKIGYIVMSVMFCIAGALFIALPDISITMIGVSMGIAMSVFGIVNLVGYFSRDLFRLAFQFDLELGILLLVLGLIVLIRPDDLMPFICIALGISILTDGLFKVQIALDSKRFGIKSWWVIFALAVVAGTIGVFLIFRSSKSAQFLTVLLGVSILAEGILNLYTVISTVLIIKHQQPDVIEIEYSETKRKDR